jgi:gluconate kinase
LGQFFLKLSEGQVDESAGEKFYKYMSQCVSSERTRIGGNWAVAQAVPTKNQRDVIRKTLGNDKVTFILLNLEKETAKKRLAQRHGDTETGMAEAEFLLKIQDFYEPKGDDEENTFDVTITDGMDQNDVVTKILEII